MSNNNLNTICAKVAKDLTKEVAEKKIKKISKNILRLSGNPEIAQLAVSSRQCTKITAAPSCPSGGRLGDGLWTKRKP